MGLLRPLLRTCYYWIRGRNYVRTIGSGTVKIMPSACLSATKIYVYPGASLILEENCIIKGSVIYIMSGSCRIGSNTIIDDTNIIIDNGVLNIGHHSKLSCKRIWIRFGGICNIGNYTNINSGSELRCDERLTIGSYDQISYSVRIWDTNTHAILSTHQRRCVTESRFPYFGFEESRPKTAPVIIGDDCWIGEGVAILKGSTIGDRSIIGIGTLISGKDIPSDCRVVNERKLKVSSI